MSTVTEIPHSVPRDVASASVRPDLRVEKIQKGVQTVYVIKDPVRLKYFELDEHEFALLEQLNVQADQGELLRWFNRRFPPLRLSHAALRQMIWRLHQQGLVLTSAAGQGSRLAEREKQSQRQEWFQRLSNPWAIRLPGINPGPWLATVDRLVGWIFNPWFVATACLAIMMLGVIALTYYREIAAMSPLGESLLSRENIALLALVVIVVKILHELGHAVAAHRQGCECHELGVLLLAGMPTLYCDISDAWTLPNRWQRMAVSVAGIWVELLISALAFVVWSTSVDGVVHAISFNVMLVCSVSTVLFNANPLVRYDGYYVLMDATGISNLGQRSRDALLRLVDRRLLGSHDSRPLDQVDVPMWAVGYGLLSAGYQFFLTGAILWGLHLALKPYSATPLLWLVVSMGFAGWGARMIQSIRRRLRSSLNSGTPVWRVIVGYGALAGLLFAVMMIPLPWLIFGDAVLEPVQRQPLVTTVAGTTLMRESAGVDVQAGVVLSQLENPEMRREFQRLSDELSTQRQHVESLSARRNQDFQAAEQIPAALAALAALEHRIAYLRNEARRLEMTAKFDGRLYSAPLRLDPVDADELPRWTGSLLDPINRDAWIEAGDEIAQVGDIGQFEATAVLAQDDLESVATGQPAEILLIGSSHIIRGEVIRVSRMKVAARNEASDRVAGANGINSREQLRKSANWYHVQIRCLDSCPEDMRVRSRGKVRIHLGSRTVGQWMAQQFFRTFRWLA